MINQEGGLNVVDNCCGTGNYVAVGVGEWLYDGFVHPHSLCSRGCAAGGQSQSGGYDQPEAEICIAQSWSKTR